MEKEFIPYTEALVLKELGFNEECLAYYNLQLQIEFKSCYNKVPIIMSGKKCGIPLYQQAFRWFRKKGYDVKIAKESLDLYFGFYWTGAAWITIGSGSYEEAELACLKKLIEIVENEKTL